MLILSWYLLLDHTEIQTHNTNIYNWAQANDSAKMAIFLESQSAERLDRKTNRHSNEFLMLWRIFFHCWLPSWNLYEFKWFHQERSYWRKFASTTKLFRKWFQCLEPKGEFVANKRVCRICIVYVCVCVWNVSVAHFAIGLRRRMVYRWQRNSILLCKHKIVYSVWIW